MQYAVRRAAMHAVITKRVSCHTLRHSFATELLQQGVSLYDIKELLGHASIQTTTIYTHVVADEIQDVLSPFDTLKENRG